MHKVKKWIGGELDSHISVRWFVVEIYYNRIGLPKCIYTKA